MDRLLNQKKPERLTGEPALKARPGDPEYALQKKGGWIAGLKKVSPADAATTAGLLLRMHAHLH